MEALRRAGLKLYSAMSPSRKLVGMDRALNSYWVIREPSAAGRLEKREVWYAKGGALDTEDVPVLWWSWLSYRRETPPSEAEIAAEETRVQTMAAKVKLIDERDEARARQDEARRAEE
eukprot:TRINITY_DN7104_c2_g1_i1.p2 TRINITY_DN7104_c2_g1~~TRINITY_DN7104_c2_g1_i1.p2  ORF type:complete len:118 (-),score=35.44 TRINITY_DN7104_c2_g1_i1:43-396(-)